VALPKPSHHSSSSTDTSGAQKTDTPAESAGGVPSLVTKALSEFVAALVKADGGELYLVSATMDDVHLHLTGTCAGCPGATMTRERLLEPAVHGAAPKATLRVTTGWRVPDGARKVE
jgi:Fe-S cluster biogenesis protein NfuA